MREEEGVEVAEGGMKVLVEKEEVGVWTVG